MSKGSRRFLEFSSEFGEHQLRPHKGGVGRGENSQALLGKRWIMTH